MLTAKQQQLALAFRDTRKLFCIAAADEVYADEDNDNICVIYHHALTDKEVLAETVFYTTIHTALSQESSTNTVVELLKVVYSN